MNINPKQTTDRILFLDILRGLAILFIFIANSYYFSGWGYTPNDFKEQFYSYQLNTIIQMLTDVFVNGKWYSIFSILFGIGFVIQYENALSKNVSFVSFFVKRLFGLLLIGSIHLVFVWQGDILTLYALLGFLLLFFRHVANKKLLIWASILLFMPVVHLLLMSAFGNFYPLKLYDIVYSYFSNHNIPIEKSIQELDLFAFANFWLDGTSFKQLFTITKGLALIRYMNILLEGRMFKVLACFLIGIWAGRMILKQQLLQNASFLKKVVLFGVLIGIPMNILLTYAKMQHEEPWKLIKFISYALGVVPLACSYVAMVALLVSRGNKILSIVAPVGQMALSNYIFQTIISILFFYGVGLGFAFDLPLWQIMLFVFVIFTLQIVFSKVWLSYFKYGPLEWLWRVMTYQKFIKILR